MLFIVLIGLTQGVYIKLPIEDKYMTPFNESTRTFIKLTPNKEQAMDVKIIKSGTNNNINNNNINNTVTIRFEDKVFDVAATNKLNLFKFHGNKNQQFKISKIDSNRYNIINRDNCLEYDPKTMYILRKPCSGSEYQIFESVDEIVTNPLPFELNYEKYGFENNEPDPIYKTNTEPIYHHHYN